MKQYRDIGILSIVVIAVLFLVGNLCPVEHIVGIPCPGCNMFTALYWLCIKGNLAVAQYYHPAILPFIIYGICVLLLYTRYQHKMLDHRYFKICSIIFLIIFISVYGYRMVNVFPDYPMSFNSDAFIIRLFHVL